MAKGVQGSEASKRLHNEFVTKIATHLTSLRSGADLTSDARLGREFLAGFAQIRNEDAGNILRKLLEPLQTECGDDIGGALLDATKEQVLRLGDEEIGLCLKRRLRGMTRERVGFIFGLLLNKCAETETMH